MGTRGSAGALRGCDEVTGLRRSSVGGDRRRLREADALPAGALSAGDLPAEARGFGTQPHVLA